jgi:hypothetical protein
MGQGSSSLDAEAEQFGGGPSVEEELAELDAKPVSGSSGKTRRSGGRAKTHRAPAGRRNKTRKTR